jgi:hypothetical protein
MPGSLNRLSGLAGAQSDVPVAIEASSRPNDPTRSATTPGRRARFKPNLDHDAVWHHPARDAEQPTRSVANHVE